MKIVVSLVFIVLLVTEASAQRRPKYKADKVEYHGRGKVKFRKLLGNVVFSHESTVVKCDSAYQYPRDNKLEAFGRVHIKDGDSVTITSKKLIYDGAERMALLREDVVYRSGSRTLYTDVLDYNLDSEIADFRQNGKLLDAENVLTSRSGTFYSLANYAIFYKNVKLVSPDYDLESDTLEYSTTTKIAITKGPTNIITEDNTTVYSEGGEFKTTVEISVFEDGVIESEDYILEGDEIYLDDATKFYKAIGNVKLISKKEDMIIVGEEGIYQRDDGISKIFGNPVMKKVMEKDTFFLAADTLVAIESDIEADERILAYYKVKMFKSNLQGKCDSVSYFLSDSMITMYNDPLLWNEGSQMESDSIDLLLVDEVIDRMVMTKNAFLVSQDTLGQFNQIKGRSMTAFFKEGVINAMDIEGNGESLYFALEGDSIAIGMNKILCSSMRIRFRDSKLTNISFYTQPEAQLIPPHEWDPSNMALEGFVWRIQERPTLEDVAHYYRKEDADEEKEVLESSLENPPAIPEQLISPKDVDLKQLKRIILD